MLLSFFIASLGTMSPHPPMPPNPYFRHGPMMAPSPFFYPPVLPPAMMARHPGTTLMHSGSHGMMPQPPVKFDPQVSENITCNSCINTSRPVF